MMHSSLRLLLLLLLLLAVVFIATTSNVSAFTTTSIASSAITSTSTSTSTNTKLYNVPPPSMNDVEGTKTYASKQSPPSSFFQLQQDCLLATQRALKDSHRLLEIEFPPLPASVLELDDVSAYDVAQANLNLAVEFSKGMIGVSLSDDNGDGEDSDSGEDGSENKETIQNVAILLPDEDEKCIAIERYSGKSRDQVNDETYKVEPGVIVSSLRRGDPNDDRFLKVSVKLRYVTLRYVTLRNTAFLYFYCRV
jgi:hypothetical protein